MGLEIDRDQFTPEDHRRYARRLRECLSVLETLLARPGFGAGPASIGAELEVALIDEAGGPLPLNLEVLEETVDPRMTVELDRFNLECNLRYGPLAGRPFSALRRELEDAHAELRRAAARHAARIAMVGILPTIRFEDLATETAMTDMPRYRALAVALRGARNAPFRLDIDGDDPLRMHSERVTFEGAATSLQIHLRVAPDDFAPLFNAIQLSTPVALAIAGNSPLFLGHRLWHETRIALFKQAVDERSEGQKRARRPPRVHFGSGWNREGAIELFREAVEVFPPLLPVLSGEDPNECLKRDEVPTLAELRLHQGTVWSWNRPVYDPAGGGHLRIELRTLPSGPSIPDMLANTAFAIGLGHGLAPHMEELGARLPFEHVHADFYRAARDGLGAEIRWPDGAAGIAAPRGALPAAELARALIDTARQGLRARGVEDDDLEPLLGVIGERLASGQTGAIWQRRMLDALGGGKPRPPALARLVERYVELSMQGRPVHEWPVEA